MSPVFQKKSVSKKKEEDEPVLIRPINENYNGSL